MSPKVQLAELAVPAAAYVLAREASWPAARLGVAGAFAVVVLVDGLAEVLGALQVVFSGVGVLEDRLDLIAEVEDGSEDLSPRPSRVARKGAAPEAWGRPVHVVWRAISAR